MRAIIWKEFKTISGSVMSSVLHLVTPLFLLVFFATVLGRNLQSFQYQGNAVSYLDFFAPGLVGYVTFMTFQMALTFIRHDRVSGILGITVLAQGGLAGYLGGKLVAQAGINVVKVALLVPLAVLISQEPIALWNPANMMLFLIALLLGTTVWLGLGLALALKLKRDDVREIVIMVVSMPLIFSSSMYYDISRAPGWIRAISQVNPLTYTCNVLREAYLVESATFTSDLLVLSCMAAAATMLALIIARKTEF